MSPEAAKASLRDALLGERQSILADAAAYRATPELGFKEVRTAALVAARLRELGYEVEEGLARTGLVARLSLGGPGPVVCIMGELDSLPMPAHPWADPATGVAQACGHFLQLTHLTALARLLADPANREGLVGEVWFLAVPAEEYVDLAWREDELAAGSLRAISGKQTLLLDGFFENVDVAMMCHAGGVNQDQGFTSRAGSAGMVGKRVRFHGRAAHAGRSPVDGVNVFQAVTVAMTALNANRDALPDAAFSRIHGTLTDLASTVSIVPDDAVGEFMLRARSLEDLRHLEAVFERCMASGALAVGASVHIQTLPGYLPRLVDPHLNELARANATALWGEDAWLDTEHASSSTDAGDVSHHLPVLHPNHGGCTGAPHSVDFGIADETMACVDPAILMATTLVDLLWADRPRAAELARDHRSPMTGEQYRSWARSDGRARLFDGAAAGAVGWGAAGSD